MPLAKVIDSPQESVRTVSRILLAIPFYKNERLVPPLVNSLRDCAAELNASQVEVLLINDSPDYPPLQCALNDAVANAPFPFRIIQNADNLGFVRTMNIAMADAVSTRRDVVIMNSDTILFPGAIAEMIRVAGLDPMIGFVNPRSNNATLATLPIQARLDLTPQAAFEAARRVAAQLPDMTYAPTAVGFCMLIRWQVLAEFGLFDEIYGSGYNEENDLVMRAGRCGYRAVLANKAFVWHEGETSFSTSKEPRHDLDARNREILNSRYPEYLKLVESYFRSPSYLAELLVEQLVADADGKLEVGFDFSSFGAFHNGTFKAAEQVLREAARSWRDKYNLHIICLENVYKFHDYARYNVPRSDPHESKRFAAIFRIGQPYDWNSVQRMTIKGACLGMYALDTISIDCGQIYDEHVFNIWQFALEHFDLHVTTSDLTAEQFEKRFAINPHAVRARIMHSLDLADYSCHNVDAAALPSGLTPGYVFVVGNHYPHKFVAPTSRALANAYPNLPIVALASAKPARSRQSDEAVEPVNVHRIESGNLSADAVAALFQHASVIVFPSHYEGFGIPMLEALAAKKPTFARRTPVALQMQRALDANPNLYLYDLTEELVQRLEEPPRWVETGTQAAQAHDAAAAAAALRASLERALSNVEYGSIVRRIRAAQQMNLVNPGASGLIGRQVERLIAPLLRTPLIYAAARALYRSARATNRAVRALFARI